MYPIPRKLWWHRTCRYARVVYEGGGGGCGDKSWRGTGRTHSARAAQTRVWVCSRQQKWSSHRSTTRLI